MTDIETLLENNRKWSARQMQSEPDFFDKLKDLQTPKFLWIGCSDSRVPANQILGLRPGEVFVHRNVANLVVNTDMNCLSVLQYAVEILKVEHIIVTGHYGCGGIAAACGHQQLGLIDNWLRNVKDIYSRHAVELEKIPDMNDRVDRLCEMNVRAQVFNVCSTTIVQNAWARGQDLSVHGFCYRLTDGLLHDLATRINGPEQLKKIYKMACD